MAGSGRLFDPSLYPGEPETDARDFGPGEHWYPIGVLNASMHYLYVNSKAFELAGITDRTPDPPGGKFYKEDGKLTGVVGESGAILKFMSVTPQRSQEELMAGLIDIMNKAASVGVTSMREALTGAIMGPGEVSALHQMNAARRLPVRISTAQHALLGNDAWASAGSHLDPATIWCEPLRGRCCPMALTRAQRLPTRSLRVSRTIAVKRTWTSSSASR